MADIPTITPEMAEETKIEIAMRRAGRRGSSLKDIADAACPVCGSQTVSFANDLVFEVVLAGERIVIPNLTGIRCSNCGDFAFDSGSSKIIDRYTKNKPACGYECSISTVGAGKLGMYLPKDVLRVMGITKKCKAIVTPLSRWKMIVELYPE
uniref:Uncharacterized protein n=1 Tax=uncultured Methanosarcinales archaeon TaxID=183757 RepID=A0A7H1KNW8_9EURY|nr:hypothetical protein BFFPPMPJ_00037 [uncultured Methanosarcinales archaeon]